MENVNGWLLAFLQEIKLMWKSKKVNGRNDELNSSNIFCISYLITKPKGQLNAILYMKEAKPNFKCQYLFLFPSQLSKRHESANHSNNGVKIEIS